MSRLYFTTEDEETEIKGWEYHWIRGIAADVTAGFLRTEYNPEDWLWLINPSHYMAKSRGHGPDRLQWAESFRVALFADGGGGDPLFKYKGHKIDGWHMQLNTALIMGGDAVKLATRFGAQGDIHAWIAGKNRAWVADMIEAAVQSGVYRAGLPRAAEPWISPRDTDRVTMEPSGWSDVVALLRADDTKPVVTHYSVEDGFPNRRLAEVPEDVWEDLPATEHWRLAFESLTVGAWSRRFSGLEIRPSDWNTFRYGHTLTALDLVAHDREKRVQRVIDKGWA